MVDAGVTGFKCFLIHSGVDEFPHVTREDLDAAMPILARRGRAADRPRGADGARGAAPGDTRTYRELPGVAPAPLGGRRHPDDDRAVPQAPAAACTSSTCPPRTRWPDIAAAKREGLPFTVETCPHYLTFDAEHIPDGATHLKCAPPIREAENREKLWDGLARGTIDMVVSDHSPCTPGAQAPGPRGLRGGVGRHRLAAVQPAGGVDGHARRAATGWRRSSRWMCRNPARLIGLEGVKGTLTPGTDADWSSSIRRPPSPRSPRGVLHRHPLTPYAGRSLPGRGGALVGAGRSGLHTG